MYADLIANVMVFIFLMEMNGNQDLSGQIHETLHRFIATTRYMQKKKKMKYAKVFFCQIYKVIQEKATNGCTSPVCRSNLPAPMLLGPQSAEWQRRRAVAD